MFAKRNRWALFGWWAVWTMVLWFVGLFLVGFIAGITHPKNGGAAGELAGQTWSGPMLLLSIAASAALTYFGVLPGTRRKPPSAAPVGDLDALERLGALHRSGVLNDEEFAAQKAVVLARKS